MVVGLAGGGPAETAGILPGDIVLDIDGAAVEPAAGAGRAAGSRPDRAGRSAAHAARRRGADDQRDRRGPSGSMSGTAPPGGLRVRVHATDPVRRRGLAAMLEAAGHVLTDETPDVELCDMDRMSAPLPKEAEAPVVALTSRPPAGSPAGVLMPDATAEQLDAALRAVVAGLLVRTAASTEARGFAPADDMPLLTPREREILGLIGEGTQQQGDGAAAGNLGAHGEVSSGSTVRQAGRDQPGRGGDQGVARRRDRALAARPGARCLTFRRGDAIRATEQ